MVLKDGAGSTVGRTSVGNPIRQYIATDDSEIRAWVSYMTDQEHLEARCLFELLGSEARRKFGENSDEFRQCERHAVIHRDLIKGNKATLHKKLGIKTGFDMAALGRKVRT